MGTRQPRPSPPRWILSNISAPLQRSTIPTRACGPLERQRQQALTPSPPRVFPVHAITASWSVGYLTDDGAKHSIPGHGVTITMTVHPSPVRTRCSGGYVPLCDLHIPRAEVSGRAYLPRRIIRHFTPIPTSPMVDVPILRKIITKSKFVALSLEFRNSKGPLTPALPVLVMSSPFSAEMSRRNSRILKLHHCPQLLHRTTFFRWRVARRFFQVWLQKLVFPTVCTSKFSKVV